MEFKKSEDPREQERRDLPPSDPAQLQKVKDILIILNNAVSAAKIFPSEHQTVSNFLADLYSRFKEFLDENWKLELGIEEYSFYFGADKVYEDPHPVKSLPFFFYKDGMQMLYFYRGLEKEELKGFLEAIKKVSLLPPEEADIVNALWERDFANIRYLAPDDYLETKIGVGKPPLEVNVDASDLSRGRIDLAPEDLEEVKKGALALERLEATAPEKATLPKQDEIGALLGPSDEKEMQEIESLLLSNRQISREEEYLNLILELIYLEDRMEQVPAISEVLKKFHQESLQKNDFGRAFRLLKSLHEIRYALEKKDKKKAELVESIIREISGESTLAAIQDLLQTRLEADEELLSYLKLIGPPAARLIAELFERSEEALVRELALGILREIGRQEAETLMRLAQESKPALTREIISLLSETQDKRVIPYLANFRHSRNKMVKLEAIGALAKFEDTVANKVVLSFLSDDDEDIRIAAVESLRDSSDKMVLSHVLSLAQEKAFQRRNIKERKAVFDLLASSRSGDACSLLRRVLKKTTVFPNARRRETCLCAVAALEKMATPGAEAVLQEGTKRGPKKIREACRQALRTLSAKKESSPQGMMK